MSGRLPRALAGAAALLLFGCATPPPQTPSPAPPPKLTLTPRGFTDLPGWREDAPAAALRAFVRSCGQILRQADTTALGPDGIAGTVADWRAPCTTAAATRAGDDAAARAFFEASFAPFEAGNNGAPDGLFTGYYEPELRGSRTRGGRYVVPLYGRPVDLITVELGQFRDELRGQRIAGFVRDGALVPYPSRAEIETGALANRRAANNAPLELMWVDDSIDAFVLHIQGSGRIVLTDGTIMRVGYAAQNGRPYVAIGRELIARGALAAADVTMPAIRAWLAAHPQEAQEVMNRNPSFVFFRPLPAPQNVDDGPPGAEGVALTPGRSLAVDRRFIPLGMPLWLDAADPLTPEARVRRLMIAQDTGGAITGPVRGDVFWGAGADAAERAGKMRSAGRYWLLLPRAVAARRAPVS